MMLGITTAGVSALRPGSREPLSAAAMKRNLGLENEGFIYVCPSFYDHLVLKVSKQLC